jgi:5'-3' exonuclease
LLNTLRPHEMIFVWDSERTWRKAVYAPYKAHRQRDDDYKDYKTMCGAARIVLQMLGFSCISIDGYEADDVLAALSMCFPTDRAILVSGDGDLRQLVRKGVDLYVPDSNTLLTSVSAREKLPVPLDLYVDYRMLVGDSSDNIKGVPGIGAKTAAKLLKRYGKPIERITDLHWRELVVNSRAAVRALVEKKALDIVQRNRYLMDLRNPPAKLIAQTLAARAVSIGLLRIFLPSRALPIEDLKLLLLDYEFQSFVEQEDWFSPFVRYRVDWLEEFGHGLL